MSRRSDEDPKRSTVVANRRLNRERDLAEEADWTESSDFGLRSRDARTLLLGKG